MIHVLPQVLSPTQVAEIVALTEHVQFADGRITNPGSTVKHNLQASQEDAANARIAQLVGEAIARHPDIRSLARPKQMARATVVRYEPGMTYGWHVDEALFPSTPPMRTDLSCTIFLNAPQSYEGGELMMELGGQSLSYKLEPGSALLYPSTTIHRVAPVSSGVRLAAITWLQSWVADAQQRELLVHLDEARALAAGGASDPARMQVLLEYVQKNLLRMWADT